MSDDPNSEPHDWAGLFLHAPIAAFVVDDERAIRVANLAAEALIGVGSLVGRTVESVLRGPTAPDAAARVISPEGGRITAMVTTGGGDVAVELLATPLPGHRCPGFLVQAVAVPEDLERLAALAHRDDLTGLLNRRGFLAAADALLRSAHERDKQLTVLFVDIDGLKAVNDRFGHTTGDRVITAVADALRDAFRESDAVGRVGGDEFCVTALSRNPQSTVDLRRRLLNAIGAVDVPQAGATIDVSVTVGAAHCVEPTPGVLLDLLDAADRAMYAERYDRNIAGRR